jgi:hypothetical protein
LSNSKALLLHSFCIRRPLYSASFVHVSPPDARHLD